MKTRSPILLTVTILLVLGATTFAVWTFFVPTWETTGTLAVLQRLEAVYRKDTLNTAEAVSYFLFPYDFFDEGTDFRRYRSLSNAQAALLSAEERSTRELVLFAARLGIASLQTRQFFVVMARASAGMNFSFAPIEATLDEATGLIVVSLPPIVVTNFAIVDEPAQGFPEFPISPSLWREAIALLRPHIHSAMTDSGLLETARRNAELQLGLLAEALGLREVRFEFRDYPVP